MNGKEYLSTQISLIELGKKINALDLIAFIDCLENAERGAVSLSDEARIKVCAHLNSVKDLARAFLQVKKLFEGTHSRLVRSALSQVKDLAP